MRLPLELGIGLAVLAVTLFIWLQQGRAPLFARIGGRIAARRVRGVQAQVEALQVEMSAIYRHRGRLAVGFLLHLAGWIATGVGGWIAYSVLGARIDVAAGIAIEALVAALAAATFLVPVNAGSRRPDTPASGRCWGCRWRCPWRRHWCGGRGTWRWGCRSCWSGR